MREQSFRLAGLDPNDIQGSYQRATLRDQAFKDAQRERQDRDEREARLPKQRAHSESEVVAKRVHVRT